MAMHLSSPIKWKAITDPIAQRGFDYWVARNNLDKWIGLPSRTPDHIFRELSRRISQAGYGQRIYRNR